MPYQKLTILPGIYKDDTPLSAKGYAIDSDKMRVFLGKWQSIGGWESATNDSFEGICRGLFAWRDSASQSYTAIGTHTALEVFYDGEIYDITPIVERDNGTSIDFTTVDTETTVTADWTSHGLIVGQRFTFSDASPATVGGVTIDGDFEVLTVESANQITFTAASAATSDAGPTSCTVNIQIRLAPGLVDNLGGPGYSVGGYGTGGYGQGADDTVFYPRVWTMDNWGQNLVACPRGGAIYEWSPAFTNSELVTNGTFTGSATGWTLGSGWAYGTNNVAATASSASMTQSVTTEAATWNLLEFDMSSWSTGTLTISYDSTAIISAVAADGKYSVEFYAPGGANTLDFAGTNLTCVIDNVSIKQLLTAHAIPTAPQENTAIFVDANRILVAVGSEEEVSDDFNPLLVRWSDQNDHHTWTTAADNQAGEFPLAKGGRIVRGLVSRGENVILTDIGPYVMRYVPDPNVVFSFNYIGSGGGPIGTNAVVMLGGIAYWMANTGEFFRYTGGIPEPLSCTVRRDVFDNLAPSQGEKVYAFTIAAFNEVWWLYPDFRDGNECSRYVKYNTVENCWDVGTFDRTAWIDTGAAPFAMAADTSGQIYFQEKGKSDDGNALSGYLKTAAFDLGEGDTLMRITSIIPDFEGMEGGCTITLSGYVYPTSTAVTQSVDVTPTTNKRDLRLIGRQCDLLFTFNSAPAFLRMGAHRIEIKITGMRR